MAKLLTIVAIGLGLVAFVAGLSLLLAWPFLWIWNYAVVAAVNVVNPIEYWVAFWLMLFLGLFIGASSSSSK